MPVIAVPGGFKIKGHYNGKPRLIGHGGKPFKSKAMAQRVSNIRSAFKHMKSPSIKHHGYI